MSHRQDIQDFLSARHADQVAFLAKLVREPSDNPPGDGSRHGALAAELLQELGFEVERHAVPEAACKDSGIVSATNLIVRRKFAQGPCIALNAHGDVVPPGAGWTRDPYGAQVEDGVMYGRGAAVSKSDFATFAFALLALEACGAPVQGTVELHFTYDEESGGAAGPRWLLEEGLARPDYAISAGFSYGVVTAHNGCLHLEVEVEGKQAHAALPHTGSDALEAATGILAALYEHRRSYVERRSSIDGMDGIDTPTLTVGLIRGGINTNVVPDRVTFRLDRRIVPHEDAQQAEDELETLIRERAHRYPGIRCTVRRILLAEPLTPLPAGEPLVRSILDCGSAIMGERLKAHGVPIYTDARHYSNAGIPTVLYGAGPRSLTEANAHGADENLNLEDLRKATAVVALSVLGLLR